MGGSLPAIGRIGKPGGGMICPVSTYRIQLSPEFTFEDLRDILGYLEQFQISTIYSAPFFQARKGSTHGYDITDPFHLNKEIGRLETFREISGWMQQRDMTWLQDIVPNHMAYDGSNHWLRDIFELGPESEFYRFFDIDWKEEKVMAPFLGNPLDEVLQKKELEIRCEDSGFTLNYYDNSYPLSARSYSKIFAFAGLQEWQKRFKMISSGQEKWEETKNFLVQECHNDLNLKISVHKAVEQINASEENLRKILELQYYRPVHWKKTEEEINYRRFFTINDLICLKMEDPGVFENYHSFIKELVEAGLIDGLRIDHIDGLFNPLEYLENLRNVVGNDFYIIIEKILEWDEKLPQHWPVQGTSGYAFLAEANQVFTLSNAEETFSKKYHDINPEEENYEDLVYHQKLFILWERMGGELNNLWNLSQELGLLDGEQQTSGYKNALGAILAAFPVYRIYPEEFPLKKKQRQVIEQAYQTALKHGEHLKTELDLLRDIFLGRAKKERENMFFFLQRCQQYTGPLAAKGVEDTTFYIFNRLISHNEVGDSPENFGLSVSGFHERMQRRNKDFPLSINATATHDTKRGEDARMRINVLSELEQEWFEKVNEWRRIGDQIVTQKAPDENEKYFIFQMLIGAYPFDLEAGEEFLKRSKTYLQKALREAKVHSSWAGPDVEYENGVFEFLKRLLENEEFLSSFLPFQKKIMAYGAIKSLGQSLLKVTSPGIPDIYQGTELWDLSYVDPDNRRPVDYKLRKKYLSEIRAVANEETGKFLGQLKKRFSTGKIKMFTLYKVLEQRRKSAEIFEKGEYVPLDVRKPFNDRVLAFGRRYKNQWNISIIPVMVTQLFDEKMELNKDLFDSLVINMPDELPAKWKNIYTDEILESKVEWTAKRLFKDFPVVFLTNEI